ncbi:MAG: porin family protein [Deltaproteobacteria bacterium]|nr:porin family protein [Deltaproteobacteria bacterium]
MMLIAGSSRGTRREPWSKTRLHARRAVPAAIVLALVLLLAVMLSPAPAQAKKGDRRSGMFLGSTRYLVGEDQTYGTTFGVLLGYEFIDNLELRATGSYAATSGTKNVDGVDYDLNMNTTIFRLGLTGYFNRHPSSAIYFFAGGGVGYMNYKIDYTYPTSTVNESSGSVPGGYLHMGMDLIMTRNLTIIPMYEYQGYRITTESGEEMNVYSTGFVISIRLSG